MFTNLLEKALVRGFVDKLQTGAAELIVLALFGVLLVDIPLGEPLRGLRLLRVRGPARGVELHCGDISGTPFDEPLFVSS